MKSNLFKYSFPRLLVAYKKNQSLVNAYLKGDLIEGADDDSKKIMGLTLGAFALIFLLSFVFWLWALLALIKYWNVLPTWAQVLGLLCLIGFVGGPIATLIIVYVAKNKK